MCTEVSSSVPHFLQAGSLLSPITCKCLLRVLCPVSRTTTALVCVLLKDSNRAPVARLGPCEADSFSANQKLSFYDLSILKIDILNGTLSSVFPIKIQYAFLFSPWLLRTHPCHPASFDHRNNIRHQKQAITPLIMQFFAASCHLLSLLPQLPPQLPILEHPQSVFSLLCSTDAIN